MSFHKLSDMRNKQSKSCFVVFVFLEMILKVNLSTVLGSFSSLRSEKGLLWLSGEPAGSLQLSGYSRFCWNPQLPRPDAGGWALLTEAFLWGGSTRGVYAAESDRSWKAHKMWRNPGKESKCLQPCAVFLNLLFIFLLLDVPKHFGERVPQTAHFTSIVCTTEVVIIVITFPQDWLSLAWI